MPIVLVISAYGVRRHQDRLQGDVAYARQRQATRSAKRHLSHAKKLIDVSKHKAFYAEVGRALMGYVGNKLNIAEAGMMSDEVRKRLLEKGVSSGILDPFFD